MNKLLLLLSKLGVATKTSKNQIVYNDESKREYIVEKENKGKLGYTRIYNYNVLIRNNQNRYSKIKVFKTTDALYNFFKPKKEC